MNLTGNTILITGGGSGIGQGLAVALHKLGNQVVVAGRRQEALDATTAANPGLQSIILDVQSVDPKDPASIPAVASQLAIRFPALNVLVNNSGIMRMDNIATEPIDEKILTDTITTNLLGPIRMTSALLAQLKAQPHATIINVSSGLAFVPLAPTATYCATKAAIHSYSMSLRYALKDTPVAVLELIPPYVATDLMNGASDPRAMPLNAFISEVMTLLATDNIEISVNNVKMLRDAPTTGKEYETFQYLNKMMAEHPV